MFSRSFGRKSVLRLSHAKNLGFDFIGVQWSHARHFLPMKACNTVIII